METTLMKIRKQYPCDRGWERLVHYLGKKKTDSEPLAIATILESNGLSDALWALCAVDEAGEEVRLLACDIAEVVLPLYEGLYPGDNRPRAAIETARAYALGTVTNSELFAAYKEAEDAADSCSLGVATHASIACMRTALTYSKMTAFHVSYHTGLAISLFDGHSVDEPRLTAEQDRQKQLLLKLLNK